MPDVLMYSASLVYLAVQGSLVVAVGTRDLSAWEIGGLLYSGGLLAGSYGLNLGHDFGHRGKGLPRPTSFILYSSVFYTHSRVSHNRGHHRNAATPGDPATAARGQWLYTFWIRTVVGGFFEAWALNRSFVIRGLLFQIGILVALIVFVSPVAAAAWVACATIGFLMLEAFNYVSHYGLVREKLQDGRYGKFTGAHAWSANNLIGRALLFGFPFHCDHHLHPASPGPKLTNSDDRPQFPTGYPGMVVLAFAPPLFIRVMERELAKLGKR